LGLSFPEKYGFSAKSYSPLKEEIPASKSTISLFAKSSPLFDLVDFPKVRWV